MPVKVFGLKFVFYKFANFLCSEIISNIAKSVQIHDVKLEIWYDFAMFEMILLYRKTRVAEFAKSSKTGEWEGVAQMSNLLFNS